MFRKITTFALAFIFTLAVARADLQYRETTKMEGGLIAGVAKVFGRLGGQKLDAVETRIYIHGDRLRRENPQHVQLIRLDKEDFVDINLKDRTYTILTFDQMRAQMEEAQRKMAEQSKSKDKDKADVKFTFDMRDTGKTQTINGYPCKEFVMDTKMQAEDKEQNQSGEMIISSDIWVSDSVPGYDEAREFHLRLAQKMGSIFLNRNQPAAGDPRIGKAMQEIMSKAAAMNGTPILAVVTFSTSGTGDPNAQNTQKQSEAKSKDDSPVPSFGKILGGFGRKKKEEKKEEKKETEADSSNQTASGGLILFKSRTEYNDFSAMAADASLFEIPAGFRQVSR
ncbi:MAG TPA: hypothetical protein VGQ81_12450 [Acidobacteriota bacterium]|jgi:hypothetical protein|nr:hypothetical protein [Acidobacteriota bacterium]